MIPLFKVAMSPDVVGPVNDVLMSGYIGQGEKVEEFEKLLRGHFGVPFVNTTNSGTSALQLAVQLAKGHHAQDEVLTSPLTCLATTAAILANGVNVRWVDVDPDTCNLDLTDLERKLTKNTVAVMVVHWGGYPVDLDRLREIQDRFHKAYGFRFRVIEDCAHAWGSKYKGKYVGACGNLSAFSFQAIKHLTTIEGGCLVCPSEIDYKRTKLLRWYGIDREQKTEDFRCEQDVSAIGWKMHMNDVNATVGIHNYAHSLKVAARHRDNAAFYGDALKGMPGVTLMRREAGYESSYWIYTIRVRNRDQFVAMMNAAGVMCSRVHERNDKHSCVAKYRAFLPALDAVCKDMVCIPVGHWVTDEQRQMIVCLIRKGW